MNGIGFFKRLLGGTDASNGRADGRRQAPTGTRMLVVDDSPTICAVLGRMLEQDGYEVIGAADGESALELARSGQPHLVFLDIVLPGMSGFEVLRTLRREAATQAIPIVMISGNVQATEQFYVQRYGADDFMKKPFGRAEVFERIRQLVLSGRLPARVPVEQPLPPEGVSQAEWDAIPDIAMPDVPHGSHAPPPDGPAAE